MNIAVVTLFPAMFAAVSEHGIAARAINKRAMRLSLWNPRDFAGDRRRSVDDRPFGGGAGMLLSPAPLAAAIDAAVSETADASDAPVVYLSPQGERLDQKLLAELSALPAVVLLAGRYEGIDERIVQTRVAREVSGGDYVLAGGELVAMLLIEGVARLLPGVLGNDESAANDSFADGLADGLADGALLDCPHYTRPEVFEGRAAPAVLLSGDHAAIKRWRLQQSLGRTVERRPDLLAGRALTDEQKNLLKSYQPGETR